MIASLDPAATERIKDRADLVAIVQSYMPLRKVGTDHVGLCFRHKEKTPSLHVHPGYYKCFGCGATGDVFTFIQSVEQLSFLDARRMLADRYGVSLEDRPLTASERKAAALQRIYNQRVEAECGWFWRWYVGLLEDYRADCDTLAKTIATWTATHPGAAGLLDARRQWMRVMRSDIRAGRLLVAIERANAVALDRMYRRLRVRPWVTAARVADMDGRSACDRIWGATVTDAVLRGRWA